MSMSEFSKSSPLEYEPKITIFGLLNYSMRKSASGKTFFILNNLFSNKNCFEALLAKNTLILAISELMSILSFSNSFVYLITEGKGTFTILSICLTRSFIVGFKKKYCFILPLILLVFI